MLYLYTLENNDHLKNKILQEVSFHSQEANTDEHLKRCLQKYFKQNPFINFTNIFTFYLIIDDKKYAFNISDLKNRYIANVFLGDELPQEHIDYIKNNKINTIYTKPDLLIELNTKALILLELKSTNNNKIPGSSVQQADPEGFVLFIKKNKKTSTIDIATGIYANAVTGKIQFPDRSPRPEVAFMHLEKWNHKNRYIENNTLHLSYSTKETEEKSKHFTNWQEVLTNEWLNYIKTNTPPRKWFDVNLRMLAYFLIRYYESLNAKQKKSFLDNNHILAFTKDQDQN